MEPTAITVTGAREHNLKGIRVEIPKKKLVVCTGVSGSGKSSLAFDTLYAEGQRRYVESLSTYARQFLGQMEKPHYETIRGLSPTIAIEQKSVSKNPRSTVGTITEIYDYLRLLFARAGVQHCHRCGEEVSSQSAQAMVKRILALPPRTKIFLLAPLVDNRKGEHKEVIAQARAEGLVRLRINGNIVELDKLQGLDKKFKHTVEAVVDRLIVKPGIDARLTDSVETCLKLGDGRLIVSGPELEDRMFSETLACDTCGLSFPPLSPQSFSFNSPLGMCRRCNGLGSFKTVDPQLVVPDTSRSIHDGAVLPLKNAVESRSGWTYSLLQAVSNDCKIPLDKPWEKLKASQQKIILFGTSKKVKVHIQRKSGSYVKPHRWEGMVPQLERLYAQTSSPHMRMRYARYLADRPCADCDGSRLRPESTAVRIAGRGLWELCNEPIGKLHDDFEGLVLDGSRAEIAAEVLKEVRSRLTFLVKVGLSYLTLARKSPTLSGGEGQRIRLASQIGSELSGVIYILDEPSIGLHQRDNQRLLEALLRLRDIGNSVVVVEHDRETIERADWVIDFGPRAGRHGGEVVFAGTPAELKVDADSLTGKYLSGREAIEIPDKRRKPKGFIEILGARENNLRNLDVRVPLGVLTCVTGVSGAGKSSLINGIVYPALHRHLHGASRLRVGAHKRIKGIEVLDKVIDINQSPIGRTPRSNPATYTKLFDPIRNLFSMLPEAKARGFKPGRFSFNVKGGRCEACEGQGSIKVEMHFLADVFVRCEECDGTRFNDATLRVKFKGHSIADVLAMSVAEAAELFSAHPHVVRVLETLVDVGLDYIQLGQSATTLSGGEAQRIKLSRELAKRSTGRTIYILDEPSTGLHFDDIRKLLRVLQRLVDAGNTVLVIEHNLEIIRAADHVIDLGPEGGIGGGRIVAQGTPEEVARCEESYTGAYLRDELAVATTL